MCDDKVRLHGLDLSTKHVVFDSREPDIWRALRKRLVDWVMSRPSASPEYEKGYAYAQPHNLLKNGLI